MPDNKQYNQYQSVKWYSLQYNQGLLKLRVMKTRPKKSDTKLLRCLCTDFPKPAFANTSFCTSKTELAASDLDVPEGKYRKPDALSLFLHQ